MSKQKSYPERDKRYYQKHRARILEKYRNQYAQLTPEQKQKRLDKASARRAIKRELRKEENIKKGFKDKYAKARSLGYRSMFEVSIVEAAEKENLPLEYEPFKLSYQINGYYVPDAVLPNGIILEFKGRLTDSDRRKMVAVKACNPELDIRFVFQNANQRIGKSKNSKTYGQWALSKGFEYSEGTIPLEWWKEEKKNV